MMMKHILKNTVLALFTAVMVSSCIFSKMDKSDNMKRVMIQVNVSAAEMTKAIMQEISADKEQAINSLRIYAFYNGMKSGHFLRETMSAEPIVMDLLLPENGTHNVEFYVIANEASMSASGSSPVLTENTTQQELKAISFNDLNNPGANGLPLYYNSLVSVNVDNISDNLPADDHMGHAFLGQQVEVDLVRPIAKLSVYAAEAVSGTSVSSKSTASLTITGVTVTNVLANGYLFPPATYPTAAGTDITSTTQVQVLKEVGTESGAELNDSDNYTQVLSPVYVFENPNGGTAWTAGYVESGSDLSALASGAMLVKIGYSFDGGATSSEAYVKMPQISRNASYKVLCRFSRTGGTHDVHISINEWNYVLHTYDEVVVKGK